MARTIHKTPNPVTLEGFQAVLEPSKSGYSLSAIVCKDIIDELETEDSNTDSDTAKKTIFDEKADKFVLPRPDYESDWTNVTKNSTYDFTHNLETQTFKLLQLIFKDDSDRIFYPAAGQHEDGSNDKGIYAYARTTNIMEVSTGADAVYMYQNFAIGDDFDVEDGFIKLMLWK